MVYAIKLGDIELDSNTSSARQNRASLEHKAGRFLLKYGLAKEYGIDLSKCEIAKNEYGKPYLKEYPEVYFNISHCKAMAVCVLGDAPVGIDIEIRRKYKESLMKRVLSDEEFRKVKAAYDICEDTIEFLKYWTLKEAYGKAIGKGMLYDYHDMSFSADGGKVICPDEDYQMWQKVIDGELVISVGRKQKESLEEYIEFIAKNINELEV